MDTTRAAGVISVYVLLGVSNFILSENFATAATTQTLLNVTGYYGASNSRAMYVIPSNVTWCDAFNECKRMGYELIASMGPMNRLLHLRNFLFVHHPELIGVPLWTGFVQPNMDNVWYLGDDCTKTVVQSATETFVNTSTLERQCLLFDMAVNAPELAYTWSATSCHDRHAFVCEVVTGPRPFDDYSGGRVLTTDISTTVTSEQTDTLVECQRNLMRSKCFVVEFNSTSRKCYYHERDLFSLPTEVTLVVSSIHGDVTVLVKTEENNVTILPAVTDDMLNQTYTDADLPCYINQTETASLASISTGLTTTVTDATSLLSIESLEEWIMKTKEENTIDEKTLSSYRSKHASAPDSRASSRVMGVIGALFIATVCGVILLSDLFRIIKGIKRTAIQWKSSGNMSESRIERLFQRRYYMCGKHVYCIRRNSV